MRRRCKCNDCPVRLAIPNRGAIACSHENIYVAGRVTFTSPSAYRPGNSLEVGGLAVAILQ